jgi:hypothetical protein
MQAGKEGHAFVNNIYNREGSIPLEKKTGGS